MKFLFPLKIRNLLEAPARRPGFYPLTGGK